MAVYEQQVQQSECGLACLAAILKMLGSKRDLRSLRHSFDASSRGSDLNYLKEVAAKLGFQSRALKLTKKDVKDLKVPAIIHWNFDHFVVLKKIKGKRFHIFDPAIGNRILDYDRFFQSFTGVALELEKSKDFTNKSGGQSKKLKLSSLINLNSNVKAAFLQSFVLFALAEFFILITPLYMKFTLDQGITGMNLKVVFIVSLAFGVFTVANIITEYLKNRSMLRLNLLMGWDLSIRIFSHMIRLPLKWFDKRILADVLSRYDSLEHIKSIIANGGVTAILNGTFMLVLIWILFLASTQMAMITIGGVLLSSLIKLLTLRKTLALSGDVLFSSITEKTRRIETIKGIQSIKSMNSEVKVESEWFNAFAENINAQEKSSVFNAIISSITKGVDGIFLILILYWGVVNFQASVISIGTIFAFLTYRILFITRFNALIDVVIQFLLLSLHTKRISDIALEQTEIDLNIPDSNQIPEGHIELKNISFSYSGYDQRIIENADFKASSGEFVSIIGASGKGKSTVLKIIMGFYPPLAGEILFDGIPGKNLGFHNLRKHIGCVMQNDQIFQGSIAENVSFFAEEIDDDRIRECLRLAEILEDVDQLPMRTNTEVGNAFSAGQTQRILIARALYKDPKILLLDESTSNLNVEIESKILNNIRCLNKTIIMVSHRPNIGDMSDRQYKVVNKKTIEME